VDLNDRKQAQRSPFTEAKITRCPYCVESGAFKEMSASDGGNWHLCARCGHLAVATDPAFECNCTKCVRLRVF
jgi:hypothetical protein